MSSTIKMLQLLGFACYSCIPHRLFHILLPVALVLSSYPALSQHDAAPDKKAAELITVGQIRLTGNKTTKPEIIFREILFKSGDHIPASYFAEYLTKSRQNLLNTALFNFVEVETSENKLNGSVVDVNFHFIERWYIWPVPLVELADRNFNEWWEDRDFSRLNFGLSLNHNNFRGRRELLQVLALLGYSQRFALSYLKPNINKAQTIGVGVSATYNRSRELAYATRNDQLAFFDAPGDFSLRSFSLNAMLYYRPQLYQSHSFSLQFDEYYISDTIFRLNPAFFLEHKPDPHFLSFIYEFRSDHRNLKAYPTSGYYFDLVLSKHGLGLLQNSNLNILNVSTSYKKYLPLAPRLYLFAGATAKFSFSNKQPYFMNRSLGYMYDFIRGYEYYVVDGKHLGYIKTNLKYEIMRPRMIYLNFIPTEKFSKLHLALYIGLHSDAGYVHKPGGLQNENKLPNRLLWGNGIGLDLVTYYDRVLRMEYSINRLGEHGFFIHFLAPI